MKDKIAKGRTNTDLLNPFESVFIGFLGLQLLLVLSKVVFDNIVALLSVRSNMAHSTFFIRIGEYVAFQFCNIAFFYWQSLKRLTWYSLKIRLGEEGLEYRYFLGIKWHILYWHKIESITILNKRTKKEIIPIIIVNRSYYGEGRAIPDEHRFTIYPDESFIEMLLQKNIVIVDKRNSL